jgi:sulfite reductase beta subunit-like hemoprotein
MDQLGFTTDMCGQGFSGARYGDPRNIVCCPASGIEQHELLNGVPLLKALSDFFIGNLDFQDMPRKFKFSISGCGCDCTRAVINDLAFVGVEKNGDVGYTLLLGGSIGSSLPGPRLAQPMGVFIEIEDAFDVAVATIEIHRDYGSRESKAKARFKWLLHCWGLEKFLDVLQVKLGKSLEEYAGPVFSREGGHEGVQSQCQEGYYYVNVPLMGGILSSENLVSLAELADQYGSGDLRLTPVQNIMIPNVEEKEQLLLHLFLMIRRPPRSTLRWNSMACASDFCGKTIHPHSKDILEDIVTQLETCFNIDFLNKAGFKIHVSGCPNNCCATLIADIGLAGTLTREKGEVKQKYNILLGGTYGSKPTLGRRVQDNIPVEKLGSKIESLLINYSKETALSIDLGKFCRKSTIEELREYLHSMGE